MMKNLYLLVAILVVHVNGAAQGVMPEKSVLEPHQTSNYSTDSTVVGGQTDSIISTNEEFSLDIASDKKEVFSYMGCDNNLPLYAMPASTDELASYYGGELWGPSYFVQGTGQTIGMWEAGNDKPDVANDNLLTGGIAPSRIIATEAGSVVSGIGHATKVALRLAGDGQGVTPHEGVAPMAKIKAWQQIDVITELAANAGSLIASNHSYAYACGYTDAIYDATVAANITWYSETNVSSVEDFKFGRYSPTDQALDKIAFDNPNHSIVIGAGNDRGAIGSSPATAYFYDIGTASYSAVSVNPGPPADGGVDGYDCIPIGATGKNTLTIGACNVIPGGYSIPADVVVQSTSVFGPVDDGRIKPDFVAASTYLTSGAAPQVTGSIALLQELSLRERGSYLKSATIKALLAQTAFEAGTHNGPDYKHGWGLINPKGAADIIMNAPGTQIRERALAHGETHDYYVFGTGADPLKVTLSWTDPEGTSLARTYTATDLDNPSLMLINDLDVRLEQISTANVDRPYVLNPAIPANAATQGDNVVDNIEKIEQLIPAAGLYRIRVSHKGTLALAQNYGLVISNAQQPDCLASTTLLFDNIWDGTTWTHPFIAGENVLVLADLVLNANTTFGTIYLADGVDVSAASAEVCTILGDVSAPASALISAETHFNGVALQHICGDVSFENVELDNSFGLEILSGDVRVYGNLILTNGLLTTNDFLALAAKAGTYAQLHEGSGTLTGEITFEQVVSGASGWRHIASPVNTTVLDVLEETDFYTLTPTGGSLLSWDATSGAWIPSTSDADLFNATTPYTMFFGFSSPYTFSTLPHTISLKGVPTTGAVNNTVVFGAATATSNGQQGWNMLANPYPENLDWNSVKLNFGPLNINGSYYVWDANADDYREHNGTIGGASYPGLAGSIAPGQSFFVKIEDLAAEVTTAFNFTNANRTLTKAAFLKTQPPYIALKATQANKEDEFYLAFQNGYTVSLENDEDAYKLLSPEKGVPQFYQQNSHEDFGLAINYVQPEFEFLSLPMAYKNTNSGLASISLDFSSINPEWSIYAEDLLTNTMHNLRTDAYFFNHNATSQANRFVIHINKKSAPNTNESFDAIIWINDSFMNIRVDKILANARIDVYTIVGQHVLSKEYVELKEERFSFPQHGVFLVHITAKDGTSMVVKTVN